MTTIWLTVSIVTLISMSCLFLIELVVLKVGNYQVCNDEWGNTKYRKISDMIGIMIWSITTIFIIVSIIFAIVY